MSAPAFTVRPDALPDIPAHVAEHLRPAVRMYLDRLGDVEAPRELIDLLAQMDADAEEASAPKPPSTNVVSLAAWRKR